MFSRLSEVYSDDFHLGLMVVCLKFDINSAVLLDKSWHFDWLFTAQSGVKYDLVFVCNVPTLLVTIFSVLVQHAFRSSVSSFF